MIPVHVCLLAGELSNKIFRGDGSSHQVPPHFFFRYRAGRGFGLTLLLCREAGGCGASHLGAAAALQCLRRAALRGFWRASLPLPGILLGGVLGLLALR